MSDLPRGVVPFSPGSALPEGNDLTRQVVAVDPTTPVAESFTRPEKALSTLYGMTGIPDLEAARLAEARGEYLPALGQALWGLGQMGSWLLPAGRGATALGERIAPGLTQDVSGAIRAFHGTPHLFSEFSSEAIGSGEGAQAYGWGHYVAGNPNVAESYKLAGAPEGYLTFEGKPFDYRFGQGAGTGRGTGSDAGDFAMSMLYHSGLSQYGRRVYDPLVDETIERLRSRARDYTAMGGAIAKEAPQQIAAADWLEKNRDSIGWEEPKGNLLEVHVLPNEEELLDWDKPLKEQTPEIREKLNSAISSLEENVYGREPKDVLNKIDDEHGKLTGENIYKALALDQGRDPWDRKGPQAVSKALHEAGIPGLKYLDQASRGGGFTVSWPGVPGFTSKINRFNTREAAENYVKSFGETQSPAKIEEIPQTRNYVIFHPSNLRIIGRNGERLEPVEGNPFEEGGP